MAKLRKYIITGSICLSLIILSACNLPLSNTNNDSISSAAYETSASSTDDILNILMQSMLNNKNDCTFFVTDESLINADDWLNSLAGIEQIKCEYRRVKGGFNVSVSFSYWDNYAIVNAYKTQDTSALNDRQLELYNKYIEILNEVTSPSNSDCKNELAIHDYLVKNISYVEQENGIYNAYNALINHTAVCSGYTECFKTFMDMLGIENTTISGTAGNELHIWNAVKLDGEWYQVDVTWDDPVGASTSYIDHSYFNVTDTDMAVDHSWDTDAANQIKAAGTKYSYANYAGLIQVNSQKEFNSLLNSFVKNKTKHFELASNTTIDIKSGFNTLNAALSYSYKNVSRNGQMIYIINITY